MDRQPISFEQLGLDRSSESLSVPEKVSEPEQENIQEVHLDIDRMRSKEIDQEKSAIEQLGVHDVRDEESAEERGGVVSPVLSTSPIPEGPSVFLTVVNEAQSEPTEDHLHRLSQTLRKAT